MFCDCVCKLLLNFVLILINTKLLKSYGESIEKVTHSFSETIMSISLCLSCIHFLPFHFPKNYKILKHQLKSKCYIKLLCSSFIILNFVMNFEKLYKKKISEIHNDIHNCS